MTRRTPVTTIHGKRRTAVIWMLRRRKRRSVGGRPWRAHASQAYGSIGECRSGLAVFGGSQDPRQPRPAGGEPIRIHGEETQAGLAGVGVARQQQTRSVGREPGLGPIGEEPGPIRGRAGGAVQELGPAGLESIRILINLPERCRFSSVAPLSRSTRRTRVSPPRPSATRAREGCTAITAASQVLDRPRSATRRPLARSHWCTGPSPRAASRARPSGAKASWVTRLPSMLPQAPPQVEAPELDVARAALPSDRDDLPVGSDPNPAVPGRSGHDVGDAIDLLAIRQASDHEIGPQDGDEAISGRREAKHALGRSRRRLEDPRLAQARHPTGRDRVAGPLGCRLWWAGNDGFAVGRWIQRGQGRRRQVGGEANRCAPSRAKRSRTVERRRDEHRSADQEPQAADTRSQPHWRLLWGGPAPDPLRPTLPTQHRPIVTLAQTGRLPARRRSARSEGSGRTDQSCRRRGCRVPSEHRAEHRAIRRIDARARAMPWIGSRQPGPCPTR